MTESSPFLQALSTHLKTQESLRSECDKINHSLRQDLAPQSGGFYSPEDWNQIQTRAAQQLTNELTLLDQPTEGEVRRAWTQVVRDFHGGKMGSFRSSRAQARSSWSPEAREMLPYLWVFFQAFFIMKIAVYYFGLEASSDETGAQDIYLYIALAFSGFSLGFFAWRMYRKERAATQKEAFMKTGKPDDSELRQKLSPLQYQVTQCDATEPPFQNEYWNEKSEGLYVDRISGEPLFSSTEKFDSGSGWPSFHRPLVNENIVEKSDTKMGMQRIEIRSLKGDSHLGHVFDDGPGPQGLRYCVNSASLEFIPKEQLQDRGYGSFLSLFDKK